MVGGKASVESVISALLTFFFSSSSLAWPYLLYCTVLFSMCIPTIYCIVHNTYVYTVHLYLYSTPLCLASFLLRLRQNRTEKRKGAERRRMKGRKVALQLSPREEELAGKQAVRNIIPTHHSVLCLVFYSTLILMKCFCQKSPKSKVTLIPSLAISVLRRPLPPSLPPSPFTLLLFKIAAGFGFGHTPPPYTAQYVCLLQYQCSTS